MRADNHEGLFGTFSVLFNIPYEKPLVGHFLIYMKDPRCPQQSFVMTDPSWKTSGGDVFLLKKMSPPDDLHEGCERHQKISPPIPHDYLPSCITSYWWGRFSIELKVRIVLYGSSIDLEIILALLDQNPTGKRGIESPLPIILYNL